jgi:hypothetical protein
MLCRGYSLIRHLLRIEIITSTIASKPVNPDCAEAPRWTTGTGLFLGNRDYVATLATSVKKRFWGAL